MMKWWMIGMIASLIFFPEKFFHETPEQYGFSYENVEIDISPNIRLHGWYIKATPEKGVILFFHGNAGNISGRLFKAEGWIRRGFSVFLIDYRGYGQSTGEIRHENNLVEDAKAAYHWLTQEKHISPSRIILYGESLGSYPAIRLGGLFPVAAVILEAPFTSFTDLAPLHYAMIPRFLTDQILSDFRFSNEMTIGAVKAPLFILHGNRDETCPYEMGEKLFEKAPEPKGFFSIPNGMHNDLPIQAGEDYWDLPLQFIEKHLEP